MDTINEITLLVIVSIAAIGTIVTVLESVGLLPSFIAKKIHYNKIAYSVELLKKMGFKTNAQIDARALPKSDRFDVRLAEATIHKRVGVGKVENIHLESFIDLQGYTTHKINAEFFARELSTFLRRENKFLEQDSRTFAFDAVACPKNGSPILAYEFANRIDKPLLLHCGENKFNDDHGDIRAQFDMHEQTDPAKIRRVLLVDDSTTGCRKILAMINDLRLRGFEVIGCAVVFEPIGKNARAKLKDEGVELVSIFQGPKPSNG